jgi:pimeloyl-ACP methyl ester carboxylesterase
MKRKFFISIPFLFLILICVVCWIAGGSLVASHNKSVGNAPQDLNAINVEFPSESGATIHGWLIPGQKGAGAVVLMHGIRASRLDLIERARFLSKAGYTVLLFDFQAHGESKGEHITIGYLESRDARAAVKFLRENTVGEKIGVIAISMGGAAAVLAQPPLDVDALVLEEVYPSIEQAISNRLAANLGGWSRIFSPMLTLQLKPRLGFGANELHPIDRVVQNKAPKLFIAGEKDRYTTIEESNALFNAANGEKEFWVVSGAGHQDLHSFAKKEYEQKVLSFFVRHLRNTL